MTTDRECFSGSVPFFTDLVGTVRDSETSKHYSDQWGTEKGFVEFIRSSPSALRHTPSAQLGWSKVFERIRERASRSVVKIYDAACGYGGVLDQIAYEPVPEGLYYLGADIREGLHELSVPDGMDGRVRFVRWDISNPPPFGDQFDFVICRASIHHTPDPRTTFRSLCSVLAPRGTIAISAYTKKALLREAMDDSLREHITAMDTGQAFEAIKDLTRLGRDFQAVQEKVSIQQDLNFLGIPAGEYAIQDLIYRFILKCWYNPEFGEQHSHIVNYDWYHPPYAYRYDLEELCDWFKQESLAIEQTCSIPAQHFIEGLKRL